MDHLQLEEIAAQWVIREDRSLNAEERVKLAMWLEESIANRVAYLRVKTGWKGTARLSELKKPRRLPEFSLTDMLSAHLAPIAAAALMIGLGAAGFAYYSWTRPPVTYAAKTGTRPTVKLADGTSIQLNTNAEVETNITAHSRTVTLRRGEAYFEVVHDESRPFIVIVGNYRITDLGTKFSVKREGDNVRVVVAEGQVRVDSIKDTIPTSPVIVDGGNVVIAKADDTVISGKNPKGISEELSWRSGMLIFNQNTLADAADEFNQYNDRQIVVEGPARNIPISGSFRADNIGAFASLAHTALGLTVVEQTGKIIISK